MGTSRVYNGRRKLKSDCLIKAEVTAHCTFEEIRSCSWKREKMQKNWKKSHLCRVPLMCENEKQSISIGCQQETHNLIFIILYDN